MLSLVVLGLCASPSQAGQGLGLLHLLEGLLEPVQQNVGVAWLEN